MKRGRKRKFDPTIPSHIDQASLPRGCYWNNRDRYWYTVIHHQAPRKRRLADEDALLSDLHHAMELLGGVDRNTLDYLLDQHAKSAAYAELADATRDDYERCRAIINGFQTRLRISFSKIKLSKIDLPLIQGVIDAIAAGKRSYGDAPERSTPSSGAHVQRYLSAAFIWGMPRGLCKSNPAEGVDMPRERGAYRMPDLVTMKAVVALFKRRGTLPTRTRGSLSPYVWAVAVIAYECRMRSVEVRTLTDADETQEGIIVDRRKGSLGNITRWSPQLREAWDWLKRRRDGIWAGKRLPVPNRPQDRPLVVAENGRAVRKSTMSSAWRRAMAIAVEAKLITKEERFGLHGLKHRGITDTKGTKADKQLASGHRSMQMVNRYDHARPVVDPVTKS
jgi:hypothetical protein